MGVCDVPAISHVCEQAGEASASLVEAPFHWLASALGQAAGQLVEDMWKVMDTTTMVDLSTPGFTKVYSLLFGVAIFVMLGFFLLQVAVSGLRRDAAGLTRAVVGLAKSMLGSFLALTLLATALEVTDQLCIGIVHATGSTMEQMGDRMAALVATLGATNIATRSAGGTIIAIFLSCLAIGATFLVWISLLIRKALLLVAIVFAPFALAGATWDKTRAWVGRWVGFVLALILSKLVVVVVFLLATTQVAAPIDADLASLSDPLGGIVLMLIAGFAPYLTYKAISFIGFDMYHAMSAEQEAKQALNRPVPMPVRRPLQAAQVLSGEDGETRTQLGGGSAPPNRSSGASSKPSTPPPINPATATAAASAEATKRIGTAWQRLQERVGSTADSQSNAPASPPTASSTAAPNRSRPMPHAADTTLDENGGPTR